MNWKWAIPILALSLMITSTALADNHESCGETCCCCDDDWTIHGDWLYWNARGCKLEYAMDTDASATAIGTVHRVKPKYDHGYRVGMHKACDNLCFDLNYSNYTTGKTDEYTNTSGEIGAILMIEEFSANSHGAIDLARARWTLNYDVVEACLCYNYRPSCCYKIAGMTCVKYALIDQAFHVFYSQTTNIFGGGNLVDVVDSTIKMWAAGAGLGFNSEYRFRDCLDLYCNFSIDLLLGDFTRKYQFQRSNNGLASMINAAESGRQCYQVMTVFNSDVGVRAAINCFDCFDVAFTLGYDVQHWIDASGFIYFIGEASGDDIVIDRYLQNLGLDGLIAKLSISF